MRISIQNKSLIFSIYASLNILYGFYWMYLGEIGGDFKNQEFKIDNYAEYFLVFTLEILLMFILYFTLCLIIKKYSSKKVDLLSYKGWLLLSLIILCLQVLYLLYAIYTGVGVLGYKEEIINVGPIRFLFTLFNSDYLCVIYIFLININKKNKMNLYKINMIIYIVSSLYRGWIAGALLNIMAMFLLSHGDLKIRLRMLMPYIALVLLSIPNVYYIKYISRGAENLSIDSYSAYYTPSIYLKVFESATSRFQHISETYAIYVNSDKVKVSYSNSEFVPFIFDHQFRKVLANTFDIEYKTFGEYVAQEILKREVGGNTHVGILSWLNINYLVSLLYMVFFFVSSIVITLLSRVILPYKSSILLITWFWIVYFMHGWISSYFIVMLSMFEISLLYYILIRFGFLNKKETNAIAAK